MAKQTARQAPEAREEEQAPAPTGTARCTSSGCGISVPRSGPTTPSSGLRYNVTV